MSLLQFLCLFQSELYCGHSSSDDYLSGELVIVSEKDIEYVIFFSLAPLYIAVSIVPVQIPKKAFA